MNTCVSDEQVIINVMGLRHVTWGETTYCGGSNAGRPWHITVTYKGSHNVFYYRTEAEVRSIFNKVRAAMDKTYAKNTDGI